MTSREIAELTGKEHKNVLTDIRKMFEELAIDSAGFSAEYKDATGRTLPAFTLPKRETYILITGYSVSMRAKIIDRWQELEAKVQQANLDKLDNPAFVKELIEEAANIAVEQAQNLRNVSFDMLRQDIVLLDDHCRMMGCGPEHIKTLSIRLLEYYGRKDLATVVQMLGNAPEYDQHQSFRAVEKHAEALAAERDRARKMLGKKPLPQLTAEQAQAVSDNYRMRFMPYSLVYDPLFTPHFEVHEQQALSPAQVLANSNVSMTMRRATGDMSATWHGSMGLLRLIAEDKAKLPA
jgi:phage regulator Rha-like protein